MKYLHSDPDIMGGALVIKGTRIPVDELLYLLQEGYSVGDIQERYPWVERNKLEGAIGEVLSEATNLLATKHHD